MNKLFVNPFALAKPLTEPCFFAEVPCVGVRSKEINILKMLDHPSIARSSTSHRFFDS